MNEEILYDLIELITEDPGVYIGAPSLCRLFYFISGWMFSATQSTGYRFRFDHEFRAFVEARFPDKSTANWCRILRTGRTESQAFALFRKLFAEFRTSTGSEMSIFYYDDTLADYEDRFQWDQALTYLETLYLQARDKRVLYSLIGFSWFYLIEGPCVIKRYEKDPNHLALEYWERYVHTGQREACEDPFFSFIAGYTLSLHGFLIDEAHEKTGKQLMEKCLHLSCEPSLRRLAENFLLNERTKEYVSVKNGAAICRRFFQGRSLLDGYFREIYAPRPAPGAQPSQTEG